MDSDQLIKNLILCIIVYLILKFIQNYNRDKFPRFVFDNANLDPMKNL